MKLKLKIHQILLERGGVEGPITSHPPILSRRLQLRIKIYYKDKQRDCVVEKGRGQIEGRLSPMIKSNKDKLQIEMT